MKAQQVVEEFSHAWHKAGINPGDTVLLHSRANRTIRLAAKALGSVDGNIVLDSFLHAIGFNGTLLLPLFNFDFAAGVPFDIRSTPSQMGTLTELGRLRSGVVRTGHPIYSFAALGKRAPEFAEIDNFSGYGSDSPFGLLHHNGDKIAVLDLPDNGSMTFYHYVEEANAVDYRYHKSFTGNYTDWSGTTSTRTYGLFVRDIVRGVKTQVDPMGEILWSSGAYSGDRPGVGCGLRVIHADRMFDEVSEAIRANRAKGLLYEIG